MKIAEDGAKNTSFQANKENNKGSLIADLSSSEKQSTRPPTLNKGFLVGSRKTDNL